jgi:hypothetical protein
MVRSNVRCRAVEPQITEPKLQTVTNAPKTALLAHWGVRAPSHSKGRVSISERVVRQNIVRRKILAAMPARMTKRTELGPPRALPTARHLRVKRGIRFGPAQRAQLTLAADVRCGTETLAQAARRVWR